MHTVIIEIKLIMLPNGNKNNNNGSHHEPTYVFQIYFQIFIQWEVFYGILQYNACNTPRRHLRHTGWKPLENNYSSLVAVVTGSTSLKFMEKLRSFPWKFHNYASPLSYKFEK